MRLRATKDTCFSSRTSVHLTVVRNSSVTATWKGSSHRLLCVPRLLQTETLSVVALFFFGLQGVYVSQRGHLLLDGQTQSKHQHHHEEEIVLVCQLMQKNKTKKAGAVAVLLLNVWFIDHQLVRSENKCLQLERAAYAIRNHVGCLAAESHSIQKSTNNGSNELSAQHT